MLSMFTSKEGLMQLLLSIPCILLALTVHEVSHGFAAYKLGDPTAKNLGRLTLNPLKHLDPLGTLCMLLFGFGWARPVPINTRYFKKPRRDMALTALAGPVSNFILAFIGVLLQRIFYTIFSSFTISSESVFTTAQIILILCRLFSTLNLGLALFNLIPCPPLDGSRIFYVFLPPKLYFGVMKYERYISLALLVLLYTGLLSTPLSWLMTRILSGMNTVVGLIPFLR